MAVTSVTDMTTISGDILQNAVAASGLPSSGNELQSEDGVMYHVPDLTEGGRILDKMENGQWKVLVDIPADVRQTAEVIGEIQIPHQHEPSQTPAEEKLLKIKERTRKATAAYRKRVGTKCYKASKEALLSENEDLRARVKHLEDKLKAKIKAKMASEVDKVDKVTASEPSPAAGLAPQESSDSGVESEDELVFKPKKKKNQMRLTTGGKHGMDGEIPVIVSDPPKEGPGKLYFWLLQFFFRETERANAWMARQEAQLIKQSLGDSLESVEVQIKKHEDFEKEQEEKIHALGELAAKLIEVGHLDSKDIVEEGRATLEKRSSQLLERSRGRRLELEAKSNPTLVAAGDSMAAQQDQDISPCATFHLLGMREEAKRQQEAAQVQASNFQTMPSTPGSGPLTGPNTPAHQRGQTAQTMYNVSIRATNETPTKFHNHDYNPMLQPRRSIPNQPGNMQLYDAPNCDYEPPKNFQQNFGNPYDCPENFYNASMMSSAGYSQVADYQAHMAQGGSGKLLPGQIIAQQAAQQQQMMMAQQQQQQQYGEKLTSLFCSVSIIPVPLQASTRSPTPSTAQTLSSTRAARPCPSSSLATEDLCPMLRRSFPRPCPSVAAARAALRTASATATPPRRAT